MADIQLINPQQSERTDQVINSDALPAPAAQTPIALMSLFGGEWDAPIFEGGALSGISVEHGAVFGKPSAYSVEELGDILDTSSNSLDVLLPTQPDGAQAPLTGIEAATLLAGSEAGFAFESGAGFEVASDGAVTVAETPVDAIDDAAMAAIKMTVETNG